MTPLIIASLSGHVKVVAGLIEASADISQKNMVSKAQCWFEISTSIN